MQNPDFTPTKTKKVNKWRANLKGFFLAVVIALFIRIFLIEPYKIPSESMYPNIYKGDMIMAAKFSYGFYLPVFNYKLPWFFSPSQSKIVLFQTPTYHSPGKIREFVNFVSFGIFNLDNNEQNPKFFIKRTIATPGSFITIVDPRKNNFHHQVVINGKEMLLTPYRKNISFKDSNEYLFFKEQGIKKEHIIQFKKEESDFFNFYDNGFKGSIYVPSDNDKIEFSLVESFDNMKDIQDAQKKEILPDFNLKDLIKVKVLEKDGKSLKTPIEFLLRSSGFKTFYYNALFENSLLDNEQAFTLLLKKKLTLTTSKDYYLMMGDNRDNSSDSRYWGFVPKTLLIGSPLVRYFPFKRFGSVA
jgi:signal peptidase I